MMLRMVSCALTVVGGLAAVGCQHQDLAARRAEIRESQLRHTIQIAQDSEASRPERLDRMRRHVEWYFEHQAEEFDRNLHGAAAHVQRDFDRAEPRLRFMGEKTEKLFAGKPERIEETAIRLFY